MSEDEIRDLLSKVPEEFSIYGSLFALVNEIQAAGDKYVENITMRKEFLLICLSLFEDYAPTLQELASVFGSSYQNVKRMANQLEEERYLEIRRDSLDRRKIRIYLNEAKYKELTSNLYNGNSEFMDKLYKGVSSEDKTILMKSLLTMRKNLEDIENNLI